MEHTISPQDEAIFNRLMMSTCVALDGWIYGECYSKPRLIPEYEPPPVILPDYEAPHDTLPVEAFARITLAEIAKLPVYGESPRKKQFPQPIRGTDLMMKKKF
jgi:hypothetical protein